MEETNCCVCRRTDSKKFDATRAPHAADRSGPRARLCSLADPSGPRQPRFVYPSRPMVNCSCVWWTPKAVGRNGALSLCSLVSLFCPSESFSFVFDPFATELRVVVHSPRDRSLSPVGLSRAMIYFTLTSLYGMVADLVLHPIISLHERCAYGDVNILGIYFILILREAILELDRQRGVLPPAAGHHRRARGLAMIHYRCQGFWDWNTVFDKIIGTKW